MHALRLPSRAFNVLGLNIPSVNRCFCSSWVRQTSLLFASELFLTARVWISAPLPSPLVTTNDDDDDDGHDAVVDGD